MAEPVDENQEYALYLFLVMDDLIYCAYYKGLNNGGKIDKKQRRDTFVFVLSIVSIIATLFISVALIM